MAVKISMFKLAVAFTVLMAAGVDGGTTVRSAKLDFNGDGRSDLAIFDDGFWAVMSLDSKNPYYGEKYLGTADSFLVPGYYAGSRVALEVAEIGGLPQHAAIYDAGNWLVQDMDETFWKMNASFGFKGALPVPGDYDGDGATDVAVFSKGVWYMIQSSGPYRQVNFGFEGGTPMAGDFSGDGKDDLVMVWVDTATKLLNWAVYVSPADIRTFVFGGEGAIPVPGYHHNLENPAIPATRMNPVIYLVDKATKKGAFYVSKTNGADGSPIKLEIGTSTDSPVGGCDFDGDGRTDIAVYNNKSGVWTIGMSQEGGKTIQFGYEGAKPVGVSSFDQSAAHLPIIEPADFNGTLWKPVNHSGNGSVALLTQKYLPEYNADLWASAVIAADPAGENVRPGGVGRIVSPYSDGRPMIRFDKLGSFFQPGPVYLVVIYRDGRRQPWLLPDPSVRYD